MCIKCRRDALGFFINLFRSSTEAADLVPADAIPERHAWGRWIGGAFAAMLNLTLPTKEDREAVYRELSPEQQATLATYVQNLPADQLASIAKSAEYVMESLHVVQMLAMDALRERADAGDLEAMRLLGRPTGLAAIFAGFMQQAGKAPRPSHMNWN